MKIIPRPLPLLFILLSPSLAMAQSEPSPTPQPSFILNLFFTVLPILLIGAFIWFFFIRQIRGIQSRSIQNGEKALQTNERIAQSLDRIAKALEDRNKNIGG